MDDIDKFYAEKIISGFGASNAYDILMSAPNTQIVRAKLIFHAIANGKWADAEIYLSNAITEEGYTWWALDAIKLYDHILLQRREQQPVHTPETCHGRLISV